MPLAVGLGLGQRVISRRLLAAGAVASVLPDLDVISFRLGIAYAHDLGHRGLSHSVVIALLLGLLAASIAAGLDSSRLRAFGFVFLAAASHGFLDMCTNGGLGVAYFWPFSGDRFFLPVHPIRVSPIGLHDFLSARGLRVLASEALWVWAPAALCALALYVWRGSSRRGGYA